MYPPDRLLYFVCPNVCMILTVEGAGADGILENTHIKHTSVVYVSYVV